MGGDTEWFEDEEFWTTYAPLMFDETTWGEVPQVVDGIEKLTRLRRGASVLDLCCGVGRHAIEFAARAYKVTGIDITAAYLEAARESAMAASLDIEYLRQDARSFSRPGGFDLCVNLFTSFGYFETRDEDLALLALCARNLIPGGHLVLETLGKEVVARDFVASEEFDRAGWRVRTEYTIVGAWEAEINRWILERQGCRVDRSFQLRLYSGFEMKEAILGAGFSAVSIFGSLDGRPYDEKAETLVAVARR
ncbi:MAG: type 11 methyltransferase [Spirochaetes bacterium]|nr:MAG: type 11 methyltransferase [Spirochaetota bacterium]